jgi:hypothetical protein
MDGSANFSHGTWKSSCTTVLLIDSVVISGATESFLTETYVFILAYTSSKLFFDQVPFEMDISVPVYSFGSL